MATGVLVGGEEEVVEHLASARIHGSHGSQCVLAAMAGWVPTTAAHGGGVQRRGTTCTGWLKECGDEASWDEGGLQ